MRASPEQKIDVASPETAPTALFEAWDETGFTGEVEVIPTQVEKRPSLEALGRKAARSVVEIVQQPTHPRTLEIGDVIGRIAAERDTIDSEDAYSDLGGGMQAYRLAERANGQRFVVPLDNYQDWHKQTRQAVEQYRLSDISLVDHERMTAADRKRFDLHLFAFCDKLQHTKVYIESCGGNVPQGSHLEHEFKGRASAELMSYAKTLGYLADDIEKTGLLAAARGALGLPLPNKSWYQAKRVKVLGTFSKDRKRHGDIRMVFERDKFRVEDKRSTL